MKTIECKVRVRYSEVGRQGYAHHANYLNWFDIAQEELVTQCGMSYNKIEEMGFFLATIADHCNFIHPAQYSDELTIRLNVAELSVVKIKFEYKIIREKDAKVIAVGYSNHVFVDKNFRPHSLKKVVPDLYGKINEML